MSQDFWHDRTVFITGCTGLLGSWLTMALIECGAHVVGLVRDQVPRSNLAWSGFMQRTAIVHGDVTDYAVVERALGEYEIDTVFHLAAQTIVGIANRNPLSTFDTNIKGTWTVLEACRRSPLVTRVVVASSDKAYGSQDKLPYDESAPLQGRHPYDVSKSCADLIAHAYSVTYNLPVAITRCGNFYGGGDLNWNRIVPGTIRSVLEGKRPVIRSDGQMVRDYLYVEDAVTGYMALAENLPAVEGQAFNLGMNDPKSVLEIVQAIIAISDYPELEPIILNEASNEIPKQYLCSEKANDSLGWQPAFTLEEGLRRTMAWYRLYLAESR
ncbi:MAG: GDP-mannose 4,6-dehydratase [Thermoflexales bacterium]|nr:GDP-mannose 4,6-dehydratase [Thermoflexales bacterium]